MLCVVECENSHYRTLFVVYTYPIMLLLLENSNMNLLSFAEIYFITAKSYLLWSKQFSPWLDNSKA